MTTDAVMGVWSHEKRAKFYPDVLMFGSKKDPIIAVLSKAGYIQITPHEQAGDIYSPQDILGMPVFAAFPTSQMDLANKLRLVMKKEATKEDEIPF